MTNQHDPAAAGNEDQEHAEDVVEVREETSVHERLLRRTCEWCGDPVDYSGVGRPPRYCKDSHRKRASELRTAQARSDRPVDAGGRTAEPVREVIERTETVTRTVVKRASDAPHRAPDAAHRMRDAGPGMFPRTPQQWYAALTELYRAAGDGRVDPQWRERLAHACEMAAKQLRASSSVPREQPAAEPQLSRAERRRRERAARKNRY